MKVAVIGCGTMGEAHSREWVRIAGARLVGVCDPVAEKANRLAKLCGTTAFSSFDEMMTEGAPDVVDVCLPTPLHKEYTLRAAELGKHAEMTLDAVRAGKHVLCEKPLGITAGEMRRMVEEAKGHGVQLGTMLTGCYHPAVLQAKQTIVSGSIGEVAAIKGTNRGKYPGGWYTNPELSGGGAIIDHTVHAASVPGFGDDPLRRAGQLPDRLVPLGAGFPPVARQVRGAGV